MRILPKKPTITGLVASSVIQSQHPEHTIAGWFSYQAIYLFGAASGLLAMAMIIKGRE